MKRFPDAPRSYLVVACVPGMDFAAARQSGADALVADLAAGETTGDAGDARARLAAALDAGHPVIVRIHAAGAAAFEDDLELCRHPGVAAVMLPRAEGIDPVCAVFERTLRDVLPVVETARGLEAARAIAQVPGVVRLVFDGTALAGDLGMETDGETLDAFRAQVVLASRLGGLAPPVEGAFRWSAASASGDAPRASGASGAQVASGAWGASSGAGDRLALHDGTTRARRFGFGGRLCANAWQAAIVNELFALRRGEAT